MYIKILPTIYVTICHVLMYDGRDKNTSSQTNSSTKHILNTNGG